MALNTNDVLDLTKENIQPLRYGRKAAQLKTALQAQVDPETQQQLNKQREQYEYAIRMYEGDDPLDPYYQYVVWLEQSFPKMGRESNLMSVIEDAIIKFKDFDKYKQDQRFVKLVIKYISAQSNPLELYQEVFGRGLGTMCSILYKAWAEELDRRNDFKRANQVFQRGINCRAQPFQELEEAHIQFQLSIARKMLDGSMNEAVEDSGRNVLSKLSSKVKANRSSKDLAGVFQSTVNKLDSQRGSNPAVAKFKVFEEGDENDDGLRDFKTKQDKLPKGSISDRENVMKASKWCGQKQKQGVKISTPATPSFSIHEDPNAECKTKISVLRPRALKLKKEEFSCPVAVFEPPDPTKMPMYPKQQVYVGGRDVQLEEIRAAYYWKKMKLSEDETRAQEQNTDMDVSEEPVDLTKSNSSIDQRDIAQKNSSTCVQQPTNSSTAVESSVPQPEISSASSFVLEPSAVPTFVKPVSHKLCSESRPVGVSRRSEAFTMHSNLHHRKSEFMDLISQTDLHGERNQVANSNKTAVQEHEVASVENERSTTTHSDKGDSFAKFNKFEDDDFRLSDKYNISAFHHSPSTSFTVNTRAAMNVIQKMWESPLAHQTSRNQAIDDDFSEAVFKMPTSHKPKNVCQPLFQNSENSSRGTFKPFAPFEVFADDDGASQREVKKSNLPFPVFVDTIDENRPPLEFDENHLPLEFNEAKSSRLPFPVFCDENERRECRKNGDPFDEIPFAKAKITAEAAGFDDDLARPMGSLRMSEAQPQTPLPLIVPVNLRDTPLEPEDKENRPPKDYSTPTERRPLTGILTPAVGVPVRELGSDDSDDDENWQLHGRENEFDESCNTKAFAIRLPSSTPSSRPEFFRAPRRSSLYNGSYISEDVAGPSITNQASSVTAATNSHVAATSKNAVNLSLILENSKEQGSSSSSGHSANVVSRNFF